MYKIISDINEIRECQEKLNTILTKDTELIHCGLGFAGFRNFPQGKWYTWNGLTYELDISPIRTSPIWWSEKNKLWVSLRKVKNIKTGIWRYWNSFGLEKPVINRDLTITMQINFPETGIETRIAGIYAKDNKNRKFVLHSGKTKLGSITFGFNNKYNIEIVGINNDKIIKYVNVVGELESINFISKLRRYIEFIEKKKNEMDK